MMQPCDSETQLIFYGAVSISTTATSDNKGGVTLVDRCNTIESILSTHKQDVSMFTATVHVHVHECVS